MPYASLCVCDAVSSDVVLHSYAPSLHDMSPLHHCVSVKSCFETRPPIEHGLTGAMVPPLCYHVAPVRVRGGLCFETLPFTFVLCCVLSHIRWYMQFLCTSYVRYGPVSKHSTEKLCNDILPCVCVCSFFMLVCAFYTCYFTPM